MKRYQINEAFYSLQGEGVRAGTPNVFVRFSGCNLACSKEPGPRSPGGWDCDTEFVSGRSLTLPELQEWVQKCSPECKWLILTGGEPALQVDAEFCDHFHRLGYQLAIETNGSIELPKRSEDAAAMGSGGESDLELHLLNSLLDWITVSPKVAEHCIRQRWAHEVKYVRGEGQGIPRTVVQAGHYLISPAFEGNLLPSGTLQWCIQLVKENPQWRLSCQLHKSWLVR